MTLQEFTEKLNSLNPSSHAAYCFLYDKGIKYYHAKDILKFNNYSKEEFKRAYELFIELKIN